MEWIKTTTSAPSKEDQYLVIHKGYIEILVFNPHYMSWDTEDGDDHECDIYEVEYWMPLPHKPKK